MSALKLYYLSSEVAPFAETYQLSTVSRNVTNLLNLKSEIDIRLSQPKYGFISERKYILREVIRLRDIPVFFNNSKQIIGMKSAFIPETRVQVYFMENNLLYKELPELIYKARNGRIFSDIGERFAFFNKGALDILKLLFWAPDIILCNDWQMSLIPTLLKENYRENEFYSKIKTVYFIHSINSYRKFPSKVYDILDINQVESGKQVDSHIQAMEHADLTIVMNYESEKIMDKIKKEKLLYKKFKSINNQVIDIPNKTNSAIWSTIANTIQSACRDL